MYKYINFKRSYLVHRCINNKMIKYSILCWIYYLWKWRLNSLVKCLLNNPTNLSPLKYNIINNTNLSLIKMLELEKRALNYLYSLMSVLLAIKEQDMYLVLLRFIITNCWEVRGIEWLSHFLSVWIVRLLLKLELIKLSERQELGKELLLLCPNELRKSIVWDKDRNKIIMVLTSGLLKR